MKVNTMDLDGAALNWAVTTALGLDIDDCVEVDNLYGPQWSGPEYDVDWSYAGPIIEKARITVIAMPNGSWATSTPVHSFHHKTALLAAMRAFVQSRLGEKVDVPVDFGTDGIEHWRANLGNARQEARHAL